MLKLQGNNIYLAAMERQDCRKLYKDNEYDFKNPREPILFGCSIEEADEWFEEIQKLLKENINIRLGIFLNDGTVIGDVALQGIDDKNRSCDLGIGIAKFTNRSKGYGTEALRLIIDYGFNNLGVERVTANTLEINIPAQKALEKLGFVLEGRARKAVYFAGTRRDNLYYGLLVDEWRTVHNIIIKTHNITLSGKAGASNIMLRPLCDEHLPLLYKWNADPEVLYWSEGDDVQEYDSETVHDIYGGVSQSAFCFLVEADGVPVGECWLQKMNLKQVLEKYPENIDVRRIDMMIGEKTYWNRGIGTVIIKALVDFAFECEGVDILHVIVSDYNIRSRRVFEKNGFTVFMREASTASGGKAKEDIHLQLAKQKV